MTEILPGEPPIFETLYDYAPWSRSGRVVFLAAQIAKTGPSTLLAVGRCGEAVGFEEACASARLAARQSLAWLARASETGERLSRILQLRVLVACAPEFDRISDVADAASAVFTESLGADGRCPRSVIGVVRLPRNAPVLLEVTAELEPTELEQTGDARSSAA